MTETPDTDAEQLVFELMGLMLALHHDARFLKRPDALERASRGMNRRLAQRPLPSMTMAMWCGTTESSVM